MTKELADYIADYIKEEQDRFKEPDPVFTEICGEMVLMAIEAYEGGARNENI